MLSEHLVKKISPFLLLLSTLIWGSAVVVTKGILDSIPYLWILTIRFTGAALLLSLIFFRRFRKIDKEYIMYGALTGTFLFFGFVLQIVGLQYTTPGKNGFLIAVYCILVPFLYWITDKIRPDRYNILASILCLIGLGFISLDGDLSVNIGDIFTLLGGILFAFNIIYVAKFIPGRDTFLLTTLQFITFSLLGWVGVVVTAPPTPILSWNVMIRIAYLAVFASCICYLLQNTGQKYTAPAAAALILALEAPFTVIYSIFAGMERLTISITIGFSLIFVAIICSETKLSFLRKRKKPPYSLK